MVSLVVAHPVGIDVNDIAGNALLAHPAGDLHHFIAVAIAPAADPEAKRPVRRDGRDAGELVVGVHDRRNTIADDQIGAQMIRARGCLPRGDRCLAEVVVERPGHVEEDAIAFRAQQ